MTKYDGLDAYTELEQVIAKDLRNALGKRGFTIRHNGTSENPAKRGLSDIEMWTDTLHINAEATKTVRSGADREMLSIADHLANSKAKFPSKQCFAIYVSPETHYRMINGIRDHNLARHQVTDEKIMPLSFANFELLITRLTDAHKELYPAQQIASLFASYANFVDDERVLRTLHELLFPFDGDLKTLIEDKEQAKWQQLESNVIKDLKQIEDRLRETGIATSGSEPSAIRLLVYLVFMKLYEEKKSIEGKGRNWFQSKSFIEFQEAQGEKENKQAIHQLFDQIKGVREFQVTSLFTQYDHLPDKSDFNDDFVLKEIIKPLDKYSFYKTKVDGLGAVYEILALRSSKDVKAGQFFTPLNVVRFMVQLAELDYADVVLDPACGTGRFLIWAMDDMLSKVSGRDSEAKQNNIRLRQLWGTDNDSNVAKLAKMNMYIHGDGKGRIWDGNGLLLYKSHNIAESIDVILTNPPLGRMNYRRPEYDEEFYQKMELIPRQKAKEEVGNEDEEDIITGNLMKGGALFLNACKNYLKSSRTNAVPEWRGGKLVMILDEGILNVEPYETVQDFIKKYFYIKAIISLTQDTFIPVSKTPNKTSIIYAIKKDDVSAKQTEPIFFAHAEKVGLTTKKKPTSNHLTAILAKYQEFKHNLLQCYDGLVFNQKKFLSLNMQPQVLAGEHTDWYYKFPEELLDHRLDYVYQHPRYDNIRQIISGHRFVRLGDLIDPNNMEYGITASGQEIGKLPFINIENLELTGQINPSNMRYVDEAPEQKILDENDILISRSRLPGVCSVVTEEFKGYTYGSYIVRFKPLLSKVIPLYLAKCVNSATGQTQVSFLKTGATGSNINPRQMCEIRIFYQGKPEQERILTNLLKIEREATELDRKAQDKWEQARTAIDSMYSG
jgi:type I restriction-modification system DNA methylase subunit